MFVTNIQPNTPLAQTAPKSKYLSVKDKEIINALGSKSPEQIAIMQVRRNRKSEIIVWQGRSLLAHGNAKITFEQGKINTDEYRNLLPYFTERKEMQRLSKDYSTLKLTDLYDQLCEDEAMFDGATRYNEILFTGAGSHKVESLLVLPEPVCPKDLPAILPEDVIRILEPYVVQKPKPISVNIDAWSQRCRDSSDYPVVLLLARRKDNPDVIEEAMGTITSISRTGDSIRLILKTPFPDGKNEGLIQKINFEVRAKNAIQSGGITPEAEQVHMRYLNVNANQIYSDQVSIHGKGAEHDVLSIDFPGYYFRTHTLSQNVTIPGIEPWL